MASFAITPPALGQTPAPLTRADFSPFVAGPSDPNNPFTQGFGDRHNSWAWSMKWWKGKLFVGTSRAYRCYSRASLARIAGFLFPYPPADKDQDCNLYPDPATLPMQAEIWAWTPPHSGSTNPRGSWELVFQSPAEVPVPGRPGMYVPYDVGFRGMVLHTDAQGVEALYAVGVSTAALWDETGSVPPPRILHSTTGEKGSFTPLPQRKGTFFGDITKGSFRSPTSYNGQMFVLNGTIQGSGELLASPDPRKGNDTWQRVGPPGQLFFEVETFNGWLYLGGQDYNGGYTVLKTKAEGDPYEFITVVPAGGWLRPRARNGVKPSASVVSMHEFEGRLYVGTDNPAEVVRINPDDTWELIAGTPRRSPIGDWIYPLSGLEDGFAHQFNDHIWRQGSRDGSLYLGTYDATVNWKDDPTIGPKFQHLQGTDIYRTESGWYWTPITMQGFRAPGDLDYSDPTDGRFNFGTRSFADTPFGLFVGTANDFYGLNIFRADQPAQPNRIQPPGRVEAELTRGQPLLSWEPVAGAVKYRILRALMDQVQLRPFPVGGEDPDGTEQTLDAFGVQVQSSGATDSEMAGVTTAASAATEEDEEPGEPAQKRLASWMHRPFQQIAETANAAYLDESLTEGERRLYMVVAVDAAGNVSDNSNLVLAPKLIPATTFTDLLTRLSWLNSRRMFTSNEMAGLARFLVQQASGHAVANQMDESAELLKRLREQVLQGQVVYFPEATDLEVMLSQLIRRTKLVHNGYLDQSYLFT